MTALEFPTLDAAVPAVIKPPAVPATLKATVLAQFDAIRPEITALATRYDKVAFDVATPKGLALAKAARLELRNNGRYMLQRTEARIKDEANELKAVVAEQVAGLIQVLLPVEQSVDAQIKAEEDRRAAAKAEAERLAAESLAKHNERLDGIRQFVAKCREPGMTSERIARGIMQLGTVDLTDPDNARAVELADAHCRALDAMRTLQAQALGREQEAERLELQRQEQARVAREQAEAQARIDAELAEIRRQAAELEAQRQQSAREAAQKRMAPAYDAAIKRVGHDRPYAVYFSFSGGHGEKVPLDRVDEYIVALDALQPEPITPDEPDAAPHGLTEPAEQPDRDHALTQMEQQPEGHAGHLAQDLDRGLSEALASKPDAMQHAREAAAAIAAETPQPPPLAEPPATMTVTRINELLAPVSITGIGLQKLGFQLQQRPGPGAHFLGSDWELIKAAIIKHVGSRA